MRYNPSWDWHCSFANDGLLQFARGGSLMETVYQNCTTGRSNLFESHRQRRWLTVVSYRVWSVAARSGQAATSEPGRGRNGEAATGNRMEVPSPTKKE